MPNFKGLEDLLHVSRCTPGRISAEIAKLFHVRQTEVGLLWVEGAFLKFLFPMELQSAGPIPITSSAIAARTAASRQAQYYNKYPQVPHHTVFEHIKLSEAKPLSEMPDPIQKMMSAPILAEDGSVMGVVQVCRKGMTSSIAGADFTDDDLELLRQAAKRIANLMPEIDHSHGDSPNQMLRLQSSVGGSLPRI